MAVWFIRLGSKSDEKDKALYQTLASEHSLVKIGYGIDENLTDKGEKRIRKHLEARGNLTPRQISKITNLIDKFINGIRIGDVIISPFDRNPRKYRIGIVESKCNTVESFLENNVEDIDDFFEKHPGSGAQGSQKIKPARKVDWLTQEIELEFFSDGWQELLSKFMPATTYKLKDEIVEDTKFEYEKSDNNDEGQKEINKVVEENQDLEQIGKPQKNGDKWLERGYYIAAIVLATVTVYTLLLT